MNLELGFRFSPNDDEVITYVRRKMEDESFSCLAMGDLELYTFEAPDLPAESKFSRAGDTHSWFFVKRDETKVGASRVTPGGYWKSTGKDRDIVDGSKVLIGSKKTLVYYSGRNPNGSKSPWIMHEYRSSVTASPRTSCKKQWVVCTVFRKPSDHKTMPACGAGVLEPSIVAAVQLPPPLFGTDKAVKCQSAASSANAAVFELSEAGHVDAMFEPSEAAHAATKFHPSSVAHVDNASEPCKAADVVAVFKPCEVAHTRSTFEPSKATGAAVSFKLNKVAGTAASFKPSKAAELEDVAFGLPVPDMDYEMVDRLARAGFCSHSFSVPVELEAGVLDEEMEDCSTDMVSSSAPQLRRFPEWN